MELHPIKLTEPPRYPTREEFSVQQNTLLEHVPVRWTKTKGLVGTVAVFVAANFCAGCGPAAKTSLEEECLLVHRHSTLVENAASWTRSIYEKKFVAFGCIAIMPPQYTPEDAAGNP
ncbi:MAG: hypothetical protein JXB10_05840 [Pirellulales bacterium]|nr:hypothetical protein [Pirellulales bacterium]